LLPEIALRENRKNSYPHNADFKDLKRIAVMIPHTDITLETDLQRVLANENIIHTERIWLDEVTYEAEEKMLTQEVPRAIAYLKPTRPHAAIFGCTSASAIFGLEGEKKLVDHISAELGCPTISAFGAVLKSLKQIEAENAFLFTPYPDDLTDRVAAALNNAGIRIVFKKGMRKTSDAEIARIPPQDIIRFVDNHLHENHKADCTIISCTNLRSFECAEYLEHKYQVPVVTSNLAIHRSLLKVL
jgi:maleate isomerase